MGGDLGVHDAGIKITARSGEYFSLRNGVRE
jgi:hypothetical protein